MHRLLAALFLAFAGAGAASAATRPAVFFKQDVTDFDRISAALNSIQTMAGQFVQIGPNGEIDQGTFYISKPGKMRFDYQPPNPTMVVSNGLSLSVYNNKLKTRDSYPLSTTPLNILLSTHVNLKNNSAVIGLERQQGALILNARSNDRRMTGNITIVFAEPALELRQWTVIDAQGLATTVSLRNVQTGVAVSDTLFGLKETTASPGKPN
ncbi:MAG: outer-membrane lipoprotein carrier protein LolA [Proteobacteria bacterium]|nr:outer-membrane lipoprotein carrier protein LolA [Pseudomonadota bacterium]